MGLNGQCDVQVESRLLQAYVDLKTATLDDALQDFLPEQDPVLGAPLPSTVGPAAHELVNALVRHSRQVLQGTWAIPISQKDVEEKYQISACCLLG